MRSVQSITTTMILLVSWIAAPSASASFIYVKANAVGANSGASWTDAYTLLQSALAVAQAGDELWVSVGTYKPTALTSPPDPRSATFGLLNDVSIYGGFRGLAGDEGVNNATTRPPDLDPATPNPATDSILSGDLNGDDGPDFANYGDNVYHVVNAGSVDQSAILDGFVIIGGNASAGAVRGGGIGGTISASPTVRNCSFLNNRAQIEGGGAYGSLTIDKCLFTGNTAGSGGGASCYFNSTISRCRFEGNSATSGVFGGGGIYAPGPYTQIANCVFSRNQFASGGHGGSAATLDHLSQMVNCVISMHAGDAVRSFSGGTIISCTFFKNDVAIAFGDACSGSPSCGHIDISNTIVWGACTASPIINRGSPPATLSVTNCCVEGWDGAMGGSGNFGADPRFVDADGPDNIPGTIDDDLRLLSISPCIDRGDNSLIPPGVTTDLDSNPRIYDFPGAPGTGVDIGAYEFQADSPDVCNGTLCPGDINGDHAINALDIQDLVDALLTGVACP